MPETKLDQIPETIPPIVPTPPSGRSPISVSLGIIATAVVFVCLYYASSVIISLIVAMFIAFVLDPGVKFLERLHIPRWVGSLVMVIGALAVLYLLIYLLYDRAVDFSRNLPEYAARLRQTFAHVRVTFRNLQLNLARLIPAAPEAQAPTVQVQPEGSWLRYLMHGLGTAYGFIVTVMFIPFLVFFMLTSKQHILSTTVAMFPAGKRQAADHVLRGISRMVRQYVIGNLLVALISAAIITPFFFGVGLRYWLLMGILASFLSLIPYVGVALALAPPLLMALVQSDMTGVAPFIVIAVVVVVVHFFAINVLTPSLVGRRVKLNALSVTIAMMFWGWLWGGIGLILAVPITAAFKAVCDNVESLRPYGAWLGEEED